MGCDLIASLTPCKQKPPRKLSAHINRTAVYAWSVMWSWSEPKLGSETIFGWHSCEQVKREYGNDKKRGVFLLWNFLAMSDTNNLIVNTELTKIKITVLINLKWHNFDYPSCYLVGRPHLTFPVTTKRYTHCLNGVSAPDYDNWPVIILRARSLSIPSDWSVFTLSCSVTFRHNTCYEARAYLHQLCSLVHFLKDN